MRTLRGSAGVLLLASIAGCYSLETQIRYVEQGELVLGVITREALTHVWGEPDNLAVRTIYTQAFGGHPYYDAHAFWWWDAPAFHAWHSWACYYPRSAVVEDLYYLDRNVIASFVDGELAGYRPVRIHERMKIGPKDLLPEEPE